MVNKRKLASICKQVRGVSYTPLDVTETPTHGYIPILRANNIQNDIVFDDLVYVNRKRISSEQKLQEGDILVCASSGSKNLVGKAAMFHNFTISEVSFGAFCKVVRPTGVFAPYLAHFFNSSYYRNIISQIAQGANINNIRNEHLGNLDVPLPEESEQKRIAERLDKVQELIALQKEQLKKLDDLIKSRFIDLFGDPITNPKSWSFTTIQSLAENLDHQRKPITASDRNEGPYPYYGASGIVDYVENFIFDEKLLLISEDGANLLARVTPIAFTIAGKTWVNNHAHVLKFFNEDTQLFVEKLLNYIDLSNYITGSAQPKLNQSMLNNIPIINPPSSLQTQFADLVMKIEAQKSLLATRLTHLETLYKSLMQEYFG